MEWECVVYGSRCAYENSKNQHCPHVSPSRVLRHHAITPTCVSTAISSMHLLHTLYGTRIVATTKKTHKHPLGSGGGVQVGSDEQLALGARQSLLPACACVFVQGSLAHSLVNLLVCFTNEFFHRLNLILALGHVAALETCNCHKHLLFWVVVVVVLIRVWRLLQWIRQRCVF